MWLQKKVISVSGNEWKASEINATIVPYLLTFTFGVTSFMLIRLLRNSSHQSHFLLMRIFYTWGNYRYRVNKSASLERVPPAPTPQSNQHQQGARDLGIAWLPTLIVRDRNEEVINTIPSPGRIRIDILSLVSCLSTNNHLARISNNNMLKGRCVVRRIVLSSSRHFAISNQIWIEAATDRHILLNSLPSSSVWLRTS